MSVYIFVLPFVFKWAMLYVYVLSRGKILLLQTDNKHE